MKDLKTYYTITEAAAHLEVSLHMVNIAVAHLGIRYNAKKMLRIHIDDMKRIETEFESKSPFHFLRK